MPHFSGCYCKILEVKIEIGGKKKSSTRDLSYYWTTGAGYMARRNITNTLGDS